MKVIIVGAGQLGQLVAAKLCAMRHDVTIIDVQADGLDGARGSLDALMLSGDGTSVPILKKAGADYADLLLALSGDEAVNVLSCKIAKGLGTRRTICRTYSSEIFSDEDGITLEYLGIDDAFSSIVESVGLIFNTLHSRVLQERIAFANSDARIDIIKVPLNSKITDCAIKDLPCAEMLHKVRFAAVVRDDKLIVPYGDTELKPGDTVYVAGRDEDVDVFVNWLSDEASNPVRRIIIAGTTISALRLAEFLVKHELDVCVIESNHERAEHISNLLPEGVGVIQGDSTSKDILDEADVSTCDAFIAMTEKDGDNILSCFLASKLGAKKAIALASKPEYIGILPSSVCWFNVPQIAANSVFRLMASGIMRVDSVLQKFNAQLTEMHLTEKSKYIGKKVMDCSFPKGFLLALILRDDYAFSPNGHTVLKTGDRLIVIADVSVISKIKAYL